MGPIAARSEVEALAEAGTATQLLQVNGQHYVQSRVAAGASAWDQSEYDILVAIPASEAAGLDGFYLALPYKYNDGQHPRVQGDIITVNNRQWQLVSWHYPDGKSWRRGQDDLSSHLTHCSGFFLHRGAVNDR